MVSGADTLAVANRRTEALPAPIRLKLRAKFLILAF